MRMFGKWALVSAVLALGVLCASGGGAYAEPDNFAKLCVDGKVDWMIEDYIQYSSEVFVVFSNAAGRGNTPPESIRESDTSWLLKHFGVAVAWKLIGKTIKADCMVKMGPQTAEAAQEEQVSFSDPALELDRIAIREMHGGTYTPPTIKDIYNKVIEALADSREPDLSRVDAETLSRFWNYMFGLDDLSVARESEEVGIQRFVKKLAEDVNHFVLRKVTAKEGARKEFSCASDSGEGYLMLIAPGGRKTYVRLGQYPALVTVDKVACSRE